MDNESLIKYISAMAIFGTIGLFVKNIDVSSGEIAFWRVAVAILIILAYKLFKHEKLPFKSIKNDLLPLAASGVAVSFDWILFFEAYKYTSVSVATLSYYFCPVLLMILCPIIFKEHLTIRQCLCFAMATLGLVLIIGARPSGNSKELIGILLGLSAAVCYAFIIIMNKKINSVGGIDKTAFQFIVALIVLSVYVPLSSGFHIAELDFKGLVCLLTIGILHTAIAYSLYFTAVPKLTGAKVALFGYIDPLVAVIVSIAFLHEEITIWQIVGGVMIIGFTIFDEIKGLKQAKACV